MDFPNDGSMRISHEAIYQALFIQGRGALRRELVACLRTGRSLRVPRARSQGRGKKFVTPEVMITERPAEVEDRAGPHHWEGDLIIGLNKSAIGTLVERTTRFTMLLHLPPMEGHGEQPRIKNGPALAGHGAEAVRDAIAATISTLPEQLRRSLTWDQGSELSQHAQLRIDTGLAIYFCDPHSPWQRGTNENTNGLLRQYFPKGTDLSKHSPRRPHGGCCCPQRPALEDPSMENSRRGPRSATNLGYTRRCCHDPLNPPDCLDRNGTAAPVVAVDRPGPCPWPHRPATPPCGQRWPNPPPGGRPDRSRWPGRPSPPGAYVPHVTGPGGVQFQVLRPEMAPEQVHGLGLGVGKGGATGPPPAPAGQARGDHQPSHPFLAESTGPEAQ